MDEDKYMSYCEWANDELVFGRGNFNWMRDWSQTPPSILVDIDENIEIPF